MALEPTKRSYSEISLEPRLKDIDSAGRTRKLQAMGWSLFGGGGLGGLLGFLLGHPFLGFVLGPLLIYSVAMGVANTAGKGAGTLYMPSGSSIPRRKEYPRAKSLEVRGEFAGAVRAYEVAILEDPRGTEPYLNIARLYRDQLKELDLSVQWFRRAQREANLSVGEAVRTHRELAEIFLHTLREPRKAAPELARLAESHPDTQDGKWAARELAEIKEGLVREREDDGPEPPTSSATPF